MARIVATAALAAGLAGADSPPAQAFNPIRSICGTGSLAVPGVGAACKALHSGGKLLKAGKQLATGHVGGAVGTAVGAGVGIVGTISSGVFSAGLSAISGWVLAGAHTALKLTARVLDRSTRPQLGTTWFSSTYWRVAGIAAVLTMPFLFAAAVQALLRSDLSLLLRSALGYLPLSLLAVSVAAPVTMLLLAATDGMSAIVSSAAGGAGTHLLGRVGWSGGALALVSASPFITCFVGVLVVAGAVLLWLEMLMREAAIYVIVLMLPLVFAALVWPARRVWAVRSMELLAALVLSKFAVVCVLSLGAGALGQATGSITGLLMGLVLVILAAAAPWALVRLLPMAELATAAAGKLRGEFPSLQTVASYSEAMSGEAADWIGSLPGRMRRQAEQVSDAAKGSRGGEAEVAKLRLGSATDAPQDPGEAAARGEGLSGAELSDAGEDGAEPVGAGGDPPGIATPGGPPGPHQPAGGQSGQTGHSLSTDADPPWKAHGTFLLGPEREGGGTRVYDGQRDLAPTQAPSTADDSDALPPRQEKAEGPL